MSLGTSPDLPPGPWVAVVAGDAATISAGPARITVSGDRPEVVRAIAWLVAASPGLLDGAVGVVSALAELQARELEERDEAIPETVEMFLDDSLADVDDAGLAAAVTAREQELVVAILEAIAGPDDV